MRIISGKWKGRRLFVPADDRVRPTTDKVKEAVFNTIAYWIDEDTVVLDLFCGTGNLGLEALSRGAAFAYFGDSSKSSLALVRKNIAHLCAQEQSEVIAGDYSKVLTSLSKTADLIFLDPPYYKGYYEDCLTKIGESGCLADDGIVICEHDIKEKMPDISGFQKIKQKRYGSVGITLYSHEEL